MRPKVVPIPIDGPLFPLPEDYDLLTKEGQRLARVNACRQWTIPPPRTREVSALVPHAARRVASHQFFDAYYLQPDEEMDWDPGFYDLDPLPSPEMHWDMARMWSMYQRSLTVMPRGSAKSTTIRRDDLMKLVSYPKYSIVYATSSQSNSAQTSEIIRKQAYFNSRIQADWGPEYDVETLLPKRGVQPTGSEHFYLANSAHMRCLSATSRLRSIRPMRFRLDDPEWDGSASTNSEVLRQYMEQLLFKVVLPAVARAGSGIDWTATFVSRRHYAWHAANVVEGPNGLEAQDPRFNSWARKTVKILEPDENGVLRSCWPEMWPIDSEERDRLGLPLDTQTIEELRVSLGASAFNSEYMAMPGTGDDQYFELDPEPKGRHAWWLTNIDPEVTTDPRKSKALIHWENPETKEEVSQELGAFLSQRQLFITLDSAYTETATSDRRAATLMAWRAHDNVLFVMDMWSARSTDSKLVDEAMKMADRWRCPVLFPEVVRESFKLYQRIKGIVSTRTASQIGYSFVPRVVALKPGSMSKQAKIEALDVRVEHGLLKLPLWNRRGNPAVRRVCDQIEGFNPVAKDGGLENDDELDTVAMSIFVLRGKQRDVQKGDVHVKSIEERVDSGEYMHGPFDLRAYDPGCWATLGAEPEGGKTVV